MIHHHRAIVSYFSRFFLFFFWQLFSLKNACFKCPIKLIDMWCGVVSYSQNYAAVYKKDNSNNIVYCLINNRMCVYFGVLYWKAGTNTTEVVTLCFFVVSDLCMKHTLAKAVKLERRKKKSYLKMVKWYHFSQIYCHF